MKTRYRVAAILAVLAMLLLLPLTSAPAQAAGRVGIGHNTSPCTQADGTTAPKAVVGFDLLPTTSTYAVAPGTVSTAKLTLVNYGPWDLPIKLTHTGQLDWKHVLTQNSVIVPACGVAEIEMNVFAPAIDPPAAELVKIYATDGRTTRAATVYMYLAVNQ